MHRLNRFINTCSSALVGNLSVHLICVLTEPSSGIGQNLHRDWCIGAVKDVLSWGHLGWFTLRMLGFWILDLVKYGRMYGKMVRWFVVKHLKIIHITIIQGVYRLIVEIFWWVECTKIAIKCVSGDWADNCTYMLYLNLTRVGK